jgi:hypothetical protein
MWYRTFCACILLTVAAPLQAAQIARSAELRADRRLNKTLTVNGQVVRVPVLLRRVSETAGVDVFVQGDLLKRPVSIATRGKPIADLLDNLAVLFGGTWVKRNDGYVLVTEEVSAKEIGSLAAGDTLAEERAFFSSITPAQVVAVRTVGLIKLAQLTQQQQRLACLIARDRFLRNPEKYSASILKGTGLQVGRILETRTLPGGTLLADPSLPGTLCLNGWSIMDSGELFPETLASDNQRPPVQ